MQNNKYNILWYCIVIACVLLIYVVYVCYFNNTTNNTINSIKYIHLSIDDTILIFDDLNRNKNIYKTIFENETLNFLKECHDSYNAKFYLYCFYEFGGVSLNNSTDTFKAEFKENSDWLKFGFHALNSVRDYSLLSETEVAEDYLRVIKELDRIVGKESITTVIRMEKFCCNKKNIEKLSKTGEFKITGLLGADTQNRPNYYLDNNLNNNLFNRDYYYDKELKIHIYKTDLRIENMSTIEDIYKFNNDNIYIIFVHEWILNNENRNKIKEICKYVNDNGYTYMNI